MAITVLATALLLALSVAPSAQDLTVTTVASSSEQPSSTTAPTTTERTSGFSEPASGRPDVYSLYIRSRIKHRYARTLVSSRLANRANESQEARFSLVLPETAFISSFLIETEGKVYEAYVKEKEEAKKDYNAALASGQTAAHVGVSARDANTFEVSVNLAARQKATFNLTYEELLQRRLGAYAHAVHFTPGQPVADLRVELLITERSNLTQLSTAFLPTDAQPDAADNEADSSAASDGAMTTERTDGGSAKVVFAPTIAQQEAIVKKMGGKEEEGLTGQLVLRYDVDRPAGGEVLLDQGYFVHFFAPDDLPPLPKHVVFVLDVSGSMEGRKVQQLKEAMAAILGDLRPNDYFSLIEFSYSVTVWNLDSASNNVVYSPYSSKSDASSIERTAPSSYPATPEYIKRAQGVVARLTAGGGTNIFDALRTAIAVARAGRVNATNSSDGEPQPIIVFLTDGEPTVGESQPHKILQMVSERNNPPPSAIFSLAFGDDADLPFLKKLSLRNSGFARKIYEAADAALQLRNFYQQVASPLLANVTFTYTDANTSQLTQLSFPAFFAGGELVVAGRGDGAGASVAGLGGAGEQQFEATRLPAPDDAEAYVSKAGSSKKRAPSLERLWAYLSVRQLLEEHERKQPVEGEEQAEKEKEGEKDKDKEEEKDKDKEEEKDKDKEEEKDKDKEEKDKDKEEEKEKEKEEEKEKDKEEEKDKDKDKEKEKEKKKESPAEIAKKKALKLSLQYSFVTPLTSLVVVKPNNASSSTDPQSAQPPSRPQWIAASGGFAHKAQPLALARPLLSPSFPATWATDPLFAYSRSPSIASAGSPGFASFVRPMVPSPYLPLEPAPPLHYPSTRRPMHSTTFKYPTSEAASESSTDAVTEMSSAIPDSSTVVPVELGQLKDLAWLTNSLNGTTGSLLVPLGNGTRLLRLGVSQENRAFAECSLPPGASNSGPAHCRHLPHCVLREIQADMQSYVRYFCSIDDFAGVCCPDAAFPAAPAA